MKNTLPDESIEKSPGNRGAAVQERERLVPEANCPKLKTWDELSLPSL